MRVAELAHLELTDEEVSHFGAQLGEILTYIDKLKGLDTANVEPMAQLIYAGDPQGEAALREDTPRPCDVAETVLKNAPDASQRFFRVPKVIER